jgi:hypothetical protein
LLSSKVWSPAQSESTFENKNNPLHQISSFPQNITKSKHGSHSLPLSPRCHLVQRRKWPAHPGLLSRHPRLHQRVILRHRQGMAHQIRGRRGQSQAQQRNCRGRLEQWNSGKQTPVHGVESVAKQKLDPRILPEWSKSSLRGKIYLPHTHEGLAAAYNSHQRVYSGGAAGSWTDGALTRGTQFIAAPYSQVSGVGYESGSDTLRVYYQDKENKIREIVLNGPTETWSNGTNELPVAAAGTSLSACALPSRPDSLWVYCQTPDMKLCEMQFQDGRWFKGKLEPYPLPDRRSGCLLSIRRTFRS